MRELLVVEFKNAEDKLHYAVVGVTCIELEDDDILIKTEDPEKSFKLDENPVKEKGLKLNVYYPTEASIRELFANNGLFAKGIHVIDGRLEK